MYFRLFGWAKPQLCEYSPKECDKCTQYYQKRVIYPRAFPQIN